MVLVQSVEKEGDDPLQWLRDSIPGEPGVDYPIFSVVEETAFSCEGKVFGGKKRRDTGKKACTKWLMLSQSGGKMEPPMKWRACGYRYGPK